MNEEVCEKCHVQFCKILFDVHVDFEEYTIMQGGVPVTRRYAVNKEWKFIPLKIITDEKEWSTFWSNCAKVVFSKDNGALVCRKNKYGYRQVTTNGITRFVPNGFDFAERNLTEANKYECPYYMEHKMTEWNKE